MACKIPYSVFTENRHLMPLIQEKLSLQEKGNFMQYKNPYYSGGKYLDFWLVDEKTKEITVPMYFASEILNAPLINRRRVYHKSPAFYMKTELYDYQKEVADISMKNFDEKGATFLNVFCSYGKTVVAAYFASVFSQKLGLITLVTYPRVFIGNSWVGTFKKLTTAKVFEVGVDKEFTDDVNVILCMDTRLDTLDPSIRAKVGHFIVDEAHMYCTKSHVSGLLSVEPLYITLLTATYERDDGFELMLDRMAGSDRITRISKKPFFVIHKTTDFVPEGKEGKFGVNYGSLIKDLENMKARNEMILQGILDNLQTKMLILTLHVDYAKLLASWIEYHVKPRGMKVAVLVGNKRKYEDADIIVATKSKVSVGFDEKEACMDWRGVRIEMLWLTFSTKKIEQIAGRVFRADYPIIIDIEDKHKNLRTHWNLRKKWYISRNGNIFETNDRFNWARDKPGIVKSYLEDLEKEKQNSTETSEKPKDISELHKASIMKYLKGDK